MDAAPTLVTEVPAREAQGHRGGGASDGPPVVVREDWRGRWPWLVHGVTTAGAHGSFDLGLFGPGKDALTTLDRWEGLRASTHMDGVSHARQPHGATVRFHEGVSAGLTLHPPCDGHVTRTPGLLLAVTVADCVPVFLVAPDVPAVGMVHAGWRSAAAGILEEAVAVFRDRLGVSPEGLHVHAGPSICGACYEVGPEVFEALGADVPPGPAPVDLAGHLLARAAGLGVARTARSTHCTRCGDAPFFSHRGGDPGRQAAFVGIRPGWGRGGEGRGARGGGG